VELVAEIHRSNMTKLWPADAEARRLAVESCKYDNNDLGFRHADGTDMMIGYRLSDGKSLNRRHIAMSICLVSLSKHRHLRCMKWLKTACKY
jgi:hypothetical protein